MAEVSLELEGCRCRTACERPALTHGFEIATWRIEHQAEDRAMKNDRPSQSAMEERALCGAFQRSHETIAQIEGIV